MVTAFVANAMVRDEASRLIPQAAIGLAPEQATLVNIETVMWVDAASPHPLPAVTILGRGVRITIRLAHVDKAALEPVRIFGSRHVPQGRAIHSDTAVHDYIKHVCSRRSAQRQHRSEEGAKDGNDGQHEG